MIFIIVIVLVIVYLFYNIPKKPNNFPPGPRSLPILGAFFHLRVYGWRDLTKACLRLSKKYKTKVLGFYMSFIPFVVLHDSALIKEALNREEFDGRGDIIIGRLRSNWKRLGRRKGTCEKKVVIPAPDRFLCKVCPSRECSEFDGHLCTGTIRGIFFTDGYFWHVQRRTSLRYMRDYGFGRRDEGLESVVEGEVKEIIDMRFNGPKYPAEKEIIKGDLVHLEYFLAVPFINGICHVISQMTLSRPEYHALWKLSRNAMKFQMNTDDLGGLVSLLPWLKDIAPNWTGYKGMREGNQAMVDFARKMVDEALATYDESYNRHFIDMYIKRMREEQRTNDKTTFSVDQLCLICVDYMLPSSVGIEGFTAMLIERMILNPEAQAKVHEEIDRVVGRDRMPNLDDRSRMPYTEACIREAMRLDPPVPLGIPHMATRDTEIGGYFIPEKTIVSVNFASLHNDKNFWGDDPENFRPERFLEDGKLSLAKDKTLPFGAGHRLCPGETFSRHTIFQVFSGLMQAFQVSSADEKVPTTPQPRTQGFVVTVPDLWVRLTPR